MSDYRLFFEHASRKLLREVRHELIVRFNDANLCQSTENKLVVKHPTVDLEGVVKKTIEAMNGYEVRSYKEEPLAIDTNLVQHILDKCLCEKGRFYTIEDNKVTIKDIATIPADFVYAYFGYDTGIEGLNTVLNGGLYLPPDGPCYMVIGGTSGAGKTNLAVTLATSMIKNSDSIDINYILIEQVAKNLERTINDFGLIEKPAALEVVDEHTGKYKISIDGKGFLNIHQMPMYSTSELLELIEEKEQTIKEKKDKDKTYNVREVYVLDSINALYDASIDEQEWRRIFQALKLMTQKNNSIVIFIYERADDHKDSMLEYLADVVVHLFREFKDGEVWRTIEVLESRFQSHHHGRHPLYIMRVNDAPFTIYPLVTAAQSILPLPVGATRIGEAEYGVKIDGIINYFECTHNRKYDMEPYFLKSSVSLVDGDRGCNKSAFGFKFAYSAYRDEVLSDDSKVFETDNKANPPQEIIDEVLSDDSKVFEANNKA
ncbi:MAG: ATPase domain-containing protein, partial [Candidatus Cloacimonadaceae bacterium]|nr:ATPase domain-containing protein [Candidatus Cloacimonadaceae bacterium]